MFYLNDRSLKFRTTGTTKDFTTEAGVPAPKSSFLVIGITQEEDIQGSDKSVEIGKFNLEEEKTDVKRVQLGN